MTIPMLSQSTRKHRNARIYRHMCLCRWCIRETSICSLLLCLLYSFFMPRVDFCCLGRRKNRGNIRLLLLLLFEHTPSLIIRFHTSIPYMGKVTVSVLMPDMLLSNGVCFRRLSHKPNCGYLLAQYLFMEHASTGQPWKLAPVLSQPYSTRWL